MIGSTPKLNADAASAQAIAKNIGIELPKNKGLEISLTEQQAKQLREYAEKSLCDFSKIASVETVGVYLDPNAIPYLDGIHYSELPEDMERVLVRAMRKGELKLGVVLTGQEAAELVSALYEKYNDVEHNKKISITYAKEKQDRQNRLDSQDEYKDEF